jgi:hypothetical protein
VLRYQKIIESARERRDYGSLSLVQNQILKWFQPLKDGIEERQLAFMRREDAGIPSASKFGPHICTLSPAKLAVITSHAALMSCALHRSRFKNERITLLRLALTIGQAVEDEVLVHRVLHQRFKENQKKNKERNQMAALLSNSDANANDDTQQDNCDPDLEPPHDDECPSDNLNNTMEHTYSLKWD